MIRLAAIAIGLCGLATPSLATEWLNCADRDGAASIDLLLGALDVVSIAGMTITTGDKVWATAPEYGPGDPTVVGQAFETPETLVVDAMDDGMATKIAELRLFKAIEGDSDFIYSGTLRIPGYGAWAVSCSGG
jgi:hypothetical protein